MTKKLFLGIIFLSISLSINAQETQEPLQPFLDSLKEDIPEKITKEIVEVEEEKKIEEKLPILKKIDMPYSENPQIDKFRKEYLTDFGKKKLSNTMKRALPYRDHIHETLKEFEIPLCIEFLPVIESDFTVNAVSKSGATGIWQFMENSISGLLHKDDWVDERKDPWLSTVAAAEKLEYNYSVLKNWELALAAYNMGLNGIKSIIKSTGSSDFWWLAENGYLKTETKNYVPKFIAIADLITNAEYYDLDIVPFNKNNDINFEEITLAKQINIKTFANALKIPYETIKQLNPALLTEYTPPYAYTIRIPIGYTEKALAEIKNQYPTKTYKVQAGDSLWAIARENDTTVEEICYLNNIDQNDILSIGTILFLPIIK